ncbi:MAG: acyl-phosphate glycerol 3-phosphate acyltransferase [Planctomycetota bacterium]|nr:MAG: acyl-phosphate glycerol 3-phosphate acyltransferase [Planctomycetota bacterium]
MVILFHVLAAVMGYLLGAVPVGYLVVWLFKREDVRQYGSGRTGGTNVYRAAGIGAAILSGAGDVLKGTLAVLLARWLVGTAAAEVVAGLAAVIGHNWSVFLGWRGGAGTGTNLGVVAAFSPLVALALGVILLLAIRIVRYASVASMIVAGLVPVAFLILAFVYPPFSHYGYYALYGLLSAAVIVFALRPNIARLRAGNERRLNY